MISQVITRTKAAAISAVTVCIMAVLLIFSGEVSGGVAAGLRSSAGLLIPSLFPFMAVSAFIIRSGISEKIGIILAPVTRCFFKLPLSCSAAVFLSFAGGFPIGAKCVRLLYEKGSINAAQAEQMMNYCVCSGPAFLITGVGTLILHNAQLGIILYLSQVLSGLILGIISGRIYKSAAAGNGECMSRNIQNIPQSKNGIIDSFILSCSDAAGSVIGLTAMVALFGAITSVCDSSGVTAFVSAALRAAGAEAPFADNFFYIFTEVTKACTSIGSSGCPLWLFSFAVGFGGLCVHFQIFSILGDIPFSKLRFFVFRLMNAFLSSVIVYIVCRFYQPDGEVSLILGDVVLEYGAASFRGAAALVIMCAVFVFSLRVRSTR